MESDIIKHRENKIKIRILEILLTDITNINPPTLLKNISLHTKMQKAPPPPCPEVWKFFHEESAVI
jgi:hypothetical protein